MKTKTKTNIKIILAIILCFTLVYFYNKHQEQTRAEYAQTHNCEWVIYGSHDVCR